MKKQIRTGIDFIGITTPFYCNDGKGTFVLHKRSKKTRDEQGNWDFGSGKLEFGLEVEENVLKEVREEYGCEGIIQETLPPLSILREQDGLKTHWLATPFFVKVDLSQVKNNEPEKIDEIGFFTLDNLPQPLHTGVQKALKVYQNYFEKYKK